MFDKHQIEGFIHGDLDLANCLHKVLKYYLEIIE